MIKNIIFDLGNVVAKIKWNKVIDKYTDKTEFKELLTEVIFDSQEWIALDTGTISKTHALEKMLEKLPKMLHGACNSIMEDWCEGLEINKDIIELLEKVRKNGYKTYILSNASLDILPFLKNRDLEKYFDGKVISAEEKVIKPDEKIYKILLKRYNLKPEECVFLDDKLENIQAAIDLKINGIVYDYTKHEEMFKELDILEVNYN